MVEQAQTYLPINGELVPVDPVDPSNPATHPPGRDIVVDHEGNLGDDDAVAFALPPGHKLPDNPEIGRPVVVFESQ